MSTIAVNAINPTSGTLTVGSTLITKNVQVGQSATATNNFTLYQPSTPDGTVRLGVGNTGATTGLLGLLWVAGLRAVAMTTFLLRTARR